MSDRTIPLSVVHGSRLTSQGFLDAGWGQVIVLCTLIKMKLYYNFHSQFIYLGRHFITVHKSLVRQSELTHALCSLGNFFIIRTGHG
jgi:hypothetical protein